MTTAQTATILDALGIEDLMPEEQEELLLDINSLIFKGSLLRLLERMDEPTKEAFSTLLETDPSEDQMQEFMAKNVPYADEAVDETVRQLTDDILAVTGETPD